MRDIDTSPLPRLRDSWDPTKLHPVTPFRWDALAWWRPELHPTKWRVLSCSGNRARWRFEDHRWRMYTLLQKGKLAGCQLGWQRWAGRADPVLCTTSYPVGERIHLHSYNWIRRPYWCTTDCSKSLWRIRPHRRMWLHRCWDGIRFGNHTQPFLLIHELL